MQHRDKMIGYHLKDMEKVKRHGRQKRSSICLIGVPKVKEREN